MSFQERLHSHTEMVRKDCDAREIADFLYAVRIRGTGAVRLPEDVVSSLVDTFRPRAKLSRTAYEKLTGRSSPEKASLGSMIGFSLFREYYGDIRTFSREAALFSDSVYAMAAQHGSALDIGPERIPQRRTTRQWFAGLPAAPSVTDKEMVLVVKTLKRLVLSLKSISPKLSDISDAVRDRVVQRIMDYTNAVMRDIAPEAWRNTQAISESRRQVPVYTANLMFAIVMKHGLISHSDIFRLLPITFRTFEEVVPDVDASDWEVLNDIDVMMHLMPVVTATAKIPMNARPRGSAVEWDIRGNIPAQ